MAPAKVRPPSVLMRMVDSDLEDDFSEFPVAAKPRVAATPTMPPKKRGRPAGSTNKVTKPAQKSTSHRSSGRLAAAAAAEVQETPQAPSDQPKGRGSRKVAQDTVPDTTDKPKPTRGRPRGENAAVTPADAEQEDEDSFAQDATSQQPEPKPRGRPGRKPAAAKTEIPETQQPENDAIAHDATPQHPAPRLRGRPGRKPAAAKAEIPATQLPEEMDVDEEEHDELERLPPPLSSGSSNPPFCGAVPSSARSQRAVDVDMGDPSLRRRLSELTKKYDALEAKYRQLQEVGTKEAERNFDRLKKQADERAQTSKELISELKAELAAQTSLAKEGPKLEKKIENHEATISSLQQKITELTASLSASKAENKTLNTKLAASRSAEAALAKVPGSAVKGNSQGMRSAVNSEVIQTAQMKEDLYSDLTGLIVRGVKHGKEDVYDCLQTGRNGTLHFKLSIETDISGDGFEEAQVTYLPQLNPSRDRDLIDMLPDYLAEDITFPRPHAAKFFSRVTKALMEQVE